MCCVATKIFNKRKNKTAKNHIILCNIDKLAFALVVNDGEAIQIVQKQYSSTSTIISGTYADNSDIKLNAITVKSVAPEFVEALKKEQEIA